MRGYFGLGQLSANEKQDILNQHKSLYNGYQTMQPQVSNTQPLYVYDFAGDKDGMVVNNKGEVKKYTNMGINEQVEQKEVCDECGAMIMDGVCNECNYGHMEESEMEEGDVCECGGEMYEGVCNECGSGRMEEGTGHLDDIYKVKDLNLKKGDYDYVEGGGNDYGTFEGMHKNLYKEDDADEFVNYDDNMEVDDDFEDYESSYTEDGMDDPDNEDDGFEDMQLDEIEDFISSLDEQGGNADDMDVDDVEDAYNFVSNGPGDVYPVNEDDMYGYEPEKTYETMESAWADEEMTEITNSLKLKSLKKTMEKEKEGFKSPLKQSKNLKQNRLFGSHISPDIRREANSIAKMMGDDVEADVVKNTLGSDTDDITQRISLNFQIQGGKLLATITINSSGEVYIRGEFPQKVERRLDRLVDKIQSEELNSDINEQDVSGVQGVYGDMKRPYSFNSDGPGKGGPYQEFSYESELDEEDEFGFATHSGDFEGDDSEEEDFGFATHSGDFEGDDSEDEEWEEIDVDMKESFITQKNKITEMFNRIGKFN